MTQSVPNASKIKFCNQMESVTLDYGLKDQEEAKANQLNTGEAYVDPYDIYALNLNKQVNENEFPGTHKDCASQSYHEMQVIRKLKPMKLQFFKTKLCPWILSNGLCRKAESCRYAHSPEEVRPLPDLRRTKFCPKALQEGECQNRGTCKYAHSYEELRATQTFVKIKLCPLWLANSCTKSSRVCRFAHGEEDLRCVLDSVTGKTENSCKRNLSVPQKNNIEASFNPWSLLSDHLQHMILKNEFNSDALNSSCPTNLSLTSPNHLGKESSLNAYLSPHTSTTAKTYAVSRQSPRTDLRETLSDISQQEETWAFSCQSPTEEYEDVQNARKCTGGRENTQVVENTKNFLRQLEKADLSAQTWQNCGNFILTSSQGNSSENHKKEGIDQQPCQLEISTLLNDKPEISNSWVQTLRERNISSPQNANLQASCQFSKECYIRDNTHVEKLNSPRTDVPWQSMEFKNSVHRNLSNSSILSVKKDLVLHSALTADWLASSAKRKNSSFLNESKSFSGNNLLNAKNSFHSFFTPKTNGLTDPQSENLFSPVSALSSCENGSANVVPNNSDTVNPYTHSDCETATRSSSDNCSKIICWDSFPCNNGLSKAQEDEKQASNSKCLQSFFKTTSCTQRKPVVSHSRSSHGGGQTLNTYSEVPLQNDSQIQDSQQWIDGPPKISLTSATRCRTGGQEALEDSCHISPLNSNANSKNTSLSSLLYDKDFLSEARAASPVTLQAQRSQCETDSYDALASGTSVKHDTSAVEIPFQSSVISPSQVYELPSHIVENEATAKYTRQKNMSCSPSQVACFATSPLTVPFVYSLDYPLNTTKKSPITTATSTCKSPSSTLFPGFPIIPFDCSYADDAEHSFPGSGSGSDYFAKSGFQYMPLNSPSTGQAFTCYKDPCRTPCVNLGTEAMKKVDCTQHCFEVNDFHHSSLVKGLEKTKSFPSSSNRYVFSPQAVRETPYNEILRMGQIDPSETTASTVESQRGQNRRKVNPTRYSDPEWIPNNLM